MEISEFAQSDAEKLGAFKEREWFPEDQLHFKKEEVDFEKHASTFVAKDGSEIVGYAKFEYSMGVCRVGTLIVGKEHRKMGIAMKLMGKVEDECKENRCHKIWLETGVDWEARKLYEKLGYKEVVVLKNHFGHKDFVFMEKLI